MLILLDVPVYRLTKSDYHRWCDDKVLHQTEVWRDAGISEGRQKQEDLLARRYINKKYGPWDFNEVVGYIRLHFVGTHIRGEYFSEAKERTVQTRTKVFTYRTHKLGF